MWPKTYIRHTLVLHEPRCRNLRRMLQPSRQQCSGKTSHHGTRNNNNRISLLLVVQMRVLDFPMLLKRPLLRFLLRKSAQSQVCMLALSSLFCVKKSHSNLRRHCIFTACGHWNGQQCEYTTGLCSQSFESEPFPCCGDKWIDDIDSQCKILWGFKI